MSKKYRSLSTVCPRHFYHDYIATSAFHRIDVPIEENIDADLLAIVDAIPESLDQRCSIGHADNRKLAANLLHAEKDHSAIRIGERAIRLPKGIRQTAGCILAFGMDHLALLYKPLDLSCC